MSARRRGFTLLEVALAAVLGSIVVLAAVSMFASLGTAEKMGREAYDESTAAAVTHEIVAGAMQSLLMSNTVPPPRNANGDRVRPGREEETPEPTVDPRDLERPRLLLEPDESQPAMMEDPASEGGVLVRPQRLEVALRTRPLFVFGIELEASAEELGLVAPAASGNRTDPTAPDPANGTVEGGGERAGTMNDRGLDDRRGGSARDRARSGTGTGTGASGSRDRRASGESETTTGRADEGNRSLLSEPEAPGEATELVQGVRGVFEFEFDPGIEAGGLEEQAGWVLWWRQIYPAVESPIDEEPGPGQRVGRTRLMGNIAAASWDVLYTKRSSAGQGSEGQRLREHAAVWADDLPGYVELDIRSTSGARHQWTFEVSWGVSGEPGSVASISTPVPSSNGATGAGTSGLGAGAPVGADRARTPTSTEGGSLGSGSDRGRKSGAGRSGASSSGTKGNQERRR